MASSASLLARRASQSIRLSPALSSLTRCKRSLPGTASIAFATTQQQRPQYFSSERAQSDPLHVPTTDSVSAAGISAASSATVPGSQDDLAASVKDKDIGVKRRVSIYDIDHYRLRDIDNILDFEHLVDQLECMPTLTSEDIGPLLVPLTRRTCEIGFGRKGAELTERVLFHCLSRLPPDYTQRAAQDMLPHPNSTMYNRAIIAWGNLRTLEAAQQAEKIFQLMMAEYLQEAEWVRTQQQQEQAAMSTNTDHVAKEWIVQAPKPCRRCYKSVLRAWAVSGAPNGPSRAYEILMEMERLSDISRIVSGKQGKEGIDNDMNSVLFGVPKDRGSMVASRPFPLSIERPDQAAYNAVLSAYAKAFILKEPHALNRIKDLVQHMDVLYEATGDEEFTLDWISYHSILRAYSKYAAYSRGPLDRAFVLGVEDTLCRIHKDEKRYRKQGKTPISAHLSMPWAYGVAVEAWTKTLPVAEGIQRADDIIMALLGKKDLKGLPNPPVGPWPRQDTIMLVIRGWQRSGLPEREKRIQRLLRVVVETPYDRVHFLNESMESWTTSNWEHAPEVVEKMLEWSFSRMTKYFKPTGQTFGIAIKAWLRSDSDQAPYRAELILQKLVQIYDKTKDPYFKPRDVHLRYVMNAWMNRCHIDHRLYGLAGNHYPAEHIQSMLSLYRGADWIVNVEGHYAMAIRGWAKHRVAEGEAEPNPLHRAVALLNELNDITGNLDTYASNWVIEACCRRQPTMEARREAYDIALDTFRRSKRNSRTFVVLMKALRTQIPTFDEKHLQLVEELFRECCSSGMVHQDLVWQVASIANESMLHRLFGVPYQYANFVVQSRNNRSGVTTEGEMWNANPPTMLLIQNLPSEWSVRVSSNITRPQAAKK